MIEQALHPTARCHRPMAMPRPRAWRCCACWSNGPTCRSASCPSARPEPGQDALRAAFAARPGLVKAGNFRRSDNKLAYAYVLTPTGLREKLRLTRAFLSRKEAEFEQLQADHRRRCATNWRTRTK